MKVKESELRKLITNCIMEAIPDGTILKESDIRGIIRRTPLNEMDANLLDSKVNVEDGDGYVHVSFGKNGWGLTDEFLKIHEVVSEISKNNNIYLEKCQIDPLDDTYDFYFRYDNENFDK